MEKRQFKVGDTVKRYKQGTHGGMIIGQEFIISWVSPGERLVKSVMSNNAEHDCDNLELVKAVDAEPVVNNTYLIF